MNKEPHQRLPGQNPSHQNLPDMSQIDAVIFDLDGLLIDSEPLWQHAEGEVFAEVGLHLTHEDYLHTMGLQAPEVVAWHFSRAPWQGPGVEEITKRLVTRVIGLIESEGVLLPGAREAVEQVAAGPWKTAVASSSSLRLIHAALKSFQLDNSFEAIASAEEESHGKPHPAVYLRAAKRLGVDPVRCLALEDSLNGLLAAKAARMWCIAVPPEELRDDPRYALADGVFLSLSEWNLAL